METLHAVVNPPSFDSPCGLGQILEPMLIEAFLPKSTIERLDEWGIGGLARPTEVEHHLVEVSPPIERF